MTGQAGLCWFVILQAVRGAASALFNPALTGVMPELAASDALQQSNAAHGIGEAVGIWSAPHYLSCWWSWLGRDGLPPTRPRSPSAPACLLTIRRPPGSGAAATGSGRSAPAQARAQPAASMPGDLRTGWHEFRSRARVWSTVGSAALQNFLYIAFFVVGPMQAQQHDHGVKGWALVLTSVGLSSLPGGGLALRIRPAHPVQASCLLVTALGLPALAFGLGLPLPAVAVAAADGWAGLTASNAL